MPRMNKLSNHATNFVQQGNCVDVTYHATLIVRASEKFITLNSGGWKTVTTKRKMQQASNQFNLGYGVYQKAGQWYVEYQGVHVKFFDGITFPRSTGFTGPWLKKNLNSVLEG